MANSTNYKYKAPKPAYPKKKRKKFILTRFFIFPLLWDFLKVTFNFLLGRLFGIFILPAQRKWNKRRELPENEDFSSERYYIKTHDNAFLDTISIKPIKVHGKQTTHIISFLGQAGRFDAFHPEKKHVHYKEMCRLARENNCTVIGFNYRGVGGSSLKNKHAWSTNDLKTDGIAQVQHLLDQGIPPEKIILKGYSLGGGISALVAKHFLDLGINLYHFNERSFSSITNVLTGRIQTTGTKSGFKSHLPFKIISWLVKPLIKLFLVLTGWEIAASDAFKKIPSKYKEYMVVRSEKSKRRNHHSKLDNNKPKDDSKIPHYASLHYDLKNERRFKKKKLRTKTKYNKNKNASSAELKKIKYDNKSRKMSTKLPGEEGHEAALSNLSNKYGMNGYSFFNNFVSNTKAINEPSPNLNKI